MQRELTEKILKKAKRPVLYPLYIFMAFIAASLLLFPDFLWRYYWGPVVADAQGMPVNGITEGYNMVSTATYALIFIYAIHLIYLLFKRLRIEVSFRFISALIPVILLGSVARVLEDLSIIKEPASYLFISPLIYFWLAFLSLFVILYSDFLEKRSRYEAVVLCAIPYLLILYFISFLVPYMGFRTDPAWFLSVTAAFSIFHMYFVKKRDYERESSLFLYSMYALTVFSYYLVSYIGLSGMEHPYEILIILSVALLISTASYFSGRYIKGSFWSSALKDKSNILMIFSHALDSTATWRGTSFFSYGEKHVFSSFIMGMPYGALIFIALKIALIFAVIYILDFMYRDDMNESTKNLIKFAVVILGLAPGVRDMLRVSIGV